jgi:hypothetical protein
MWSVSPPNTPTSCWRISESVEIKYGRPIIQQPIGQLEVGPRSGRDWQLCAQWLSHRRNDTQEFSAPLGLGRIRSFALRGFSQPRESGLNARDRNYLNLVDNFVLRG